MSYYSKKVEKVFEELNSSKKGLDSAEARRRIEKYGKNELVEKEGISALKIFLSQFKSLIIYILIFATIVAAFFNQWIDATIILIVIILNSTLGFIQEYRAEKAIRALKQLSAHKAKVLRNGSIIHIFSNELVPGDIILLETGDRVPADSRIIEMHSLETQEAALTGESTPVKKEECVLGHDAVVADMRNMVFSGTIVTKGKATAIVVSTGMLTEIGKIAKLVGETKREETPLQKKLASLGRTIGYVTIAVAIIVFIVGLLFKKAGWIDMLLTSISLAVAAIPEGLPAIVTVCLAIGIQRMVKRNALIRRLPSVETLGSVTVICTDKTGTLTKNEMTVKKIFANDCVIDVSGEGYAPEGKFSLNGKPFDSKKIDLLLKAGMICNDSHIKPQIMGDPTEIALITSAEKGGISYTEAHSRFKRVDEIPFDSVRKMMSTLNHDGKNYFVFTKGAVEQVLRNSNKIFENGRVRKLTENDKKQILETNRKFAESALRVLGFAYKPSKKEKIRENDLIFIGMQAMIDPPREDAKIAMQKCKEAGIRVIMITGDHEITAGAIGREFGIAGRVVNGKELEKLSEAEIRKIVIHSSIFARVNPEHKLKIVKALQAEGNVVAMTGDGVNDAPALKKADIGIAMGKNGTDVAKEASDMILLDDNFASIVNAVEEGRGVYDNIRKFFAFLISGNIGEVLIVFFSMMFLLPLPLTAIQILLINLFTDGLPALAMSIDPFEPDSMKQKPRSVKSKIHEGLSAFILWYPIIMCVAALLIFWYVLTTSNSIVKAQTAAFLTVVMFEIYQAFTCRSTRHTVFKVGFFKNKALLGAVAISVITTFSVIFVPQLNPIFHTTALSGWEVFCICAIALSGAGFIEISKFIKTRKRALQR